MDSSKIKAKTLLHLGCGAGHNDLGLKAHFGITGVDINKPMLKQARKLNPKVRYLCGDMRKARLGKEYDVVLILDSIAYMLSAADLRAAFQTAYTHLKPGGVFLTIAETTKESFKQHSIDATSHKQGDIEITFIENRYNPNSKGTVFDVTFVYLIRRKGKLSVETDHHRHGLFKLTTWTRLLKETGFQVRRRKFEAGSCPMFVCVRPL